MADNELPSISLQRCRPSPEQLSGAQIALASILTACKKCRHSNTISFPSPGPQPTGAKHGPCRSRCKVLSCFASVYLEKILKPKYSERTASDRSCSADSAWAVASFSYNAPQSHGRTSLNQHYYIQKVGASHIILGKGVTVMTERLKSKFAQHSLVLRMFLSDHGRFGWKLAALCFPSLACVALKVFASRKC